MWSLLHNYVREVSLCSVKVQSTLNVWRCSLRTVLSGASSDAGHNASAEAWAIYQTNYICIGHCVIVIHRQQFLYDIMQLQCRTRMKQRASLVRGKPEMGLKYGTSQIIPAFWKPLALKINILNKWININKCSYADMGEVLGCTS